MNTAKPENKSIKQTQSKVVKPSPKPYNPAEFKVVNKSDIKVYYPSVVSIRRRIISV